MNTPLSTPKHSINTTINNNSLILPYSSTTRNNTYLDLLTNHRHHTTLCLRGHQLALRWWGLPLWDLDWD